jgi:hypothetical protein|tara:strand:+ start:338 stop:688 length:351 start_codon:yes stop_codon:yes gene_type:complete
MNWEKIIKATEEKPLGYTPTDYDSEDNAGMSHQTIEDKWESAAIQKLTGASHQLYDMGHNNISSVNNYLKKLMDDDPEHDPIYSEILQLSQKLEVTMDNLEDYLLDARKLLRDMGL